MCIRDSLSPERYRQYAVDRYGIVAYAPGYPFGHLADDPFGFGVKRWFDAPDYIYIFYSAVGVDDKAADNASLDLGVIGFAWIAALFVDIFHHCAISSGKVGGLVYGVVDIGFAIGCVMSGVMAD